MGANPVSPKVTAAALASAVSMLVWFIVSITQVIPESTDPAVIATATGATGTVLTFVFGYLIRDENREQGRGVPPEPTPR